MLKFLILNGPNLNLLGTREPEIYGHKSLKEIEILTQKKLEPHAIHTEWKQSNVEGELINFIQNASTYNGLIINPAGYAHTSVAILDALKTLKIPIAEVHLSNVYRRENFRQTMLTAQASTIIMSGLSEHVYFIASLALKEMHKA